MIEEEGENFLDDACIDDEIRHQWQHVLEVANEYLTGDDARASLLHDDTTVEVESIE